MNGRIAACIRVQSEAPLSCAGAEEWVAEQVTPLLLGCSPELTGLYLATADAGVQAAIQFWADGLRDGLGFANPRDFPLTLANSPAARIALRHNLQGPNYTLVGDDEATRAALEHAQDDLQLCLIEHALVVRFDMLPIPAMTGWILAAGVSPPGDQKALAEFGTMRVVSYTPIAEDHHG